MGQDQPGPRSNDDPGREPIAIALLEADQGELSDVAVVRLLAPASGIAPIDVDRDRSFALLGRIGDHHARALGKPVLGPAHIKQPHALKAAADRWAFGIDRAATLAWATMLAPSVSGFIELGDVEYAAAERAGAALASARGL
jgi:hypothetical protein